MPAKDIFHDVVKRALEKDGWIVSKEHLPLKFGTKNVFVDLGAELPLAAEKAGRKIAVEVKSLAEPGMMSELEKAVGQYEIYRLALRRKEPERRLYLAIPVDSAAELLNEVDALNLLEEVRIHLLVFDPQKESIEQWIEQSNTDKS